MIKFWRQLDPLSAHSSNRPIGDVFIYGHERAHKMYEAAAFGASLQEDMTAQALRETLQGGEKISDSVSCDIRSAAPYLPYSAP